MTGGQFLIAAYNHLMAFNLLLYLLRVQSIVLEVAKFFRHRRDFVAVNSSFLFFDYLHVTSLLRYLRGLLNDVV